MRKLTPSNLEFAVWISRLGSFTAAAERMHTTQPTVSARIKELEDFLGWKLFVRQGHGIEPTPEGREFVRKAECLLQQLDELSGSFGQHGFSGVVRLGTSSICLDLLAAVNVETSRSMPAVSYEVEIERAARLLYLLEAYKLDVVLVSGPVPGHKFRTSSLGRDRMLWVTSPEVARERAQSPRDQRLSLLPIWCVHADSFYWDGATAGLREQGADLNRVNAIGNALGVARVVGAGAGIGLVSETLVQAELAAGTLVPVPDLSPCAEIEFSIVTLADNQSAIVQEVVASAVANSRFRSTRDD